MKWSLPPFKRIYNRLKKIIADLKDHLMGTYNELDEFVDFIIGDYSGFFCFVMMDSGTECLSPHE